MPKREDKFWAGQKSDLRYCSRHKRCYDAKVGCQLCYLEESNLKREMKEIPQLQQCPECKQNSLFWNKDYSPSYGPGEDFGKKARWFGKSSRDVLRQRALSSEPDYPFDPDHVGYYKGEWKTPRRKTFSLGKILLAFLILILLAGASVYAYIKLSSSAGIHAPSGFTAIAGNMQITLSWKKKNDADQVLVRYKTTSYPTSVTDGTLLYEGNVASYSHTNLEYGKTYYFGIWSKRIVDGQWKYSDTGAFASGIPYWRGTDGEEIQEYVEYAGARIVGAGGDYIELFNNPEAHNPAWQELKQFLWQDKTDQHLYNLTSFVCADFAEMLHNNAENAGIRAAYISIDLSSYSEGHALNAFNTTDKGLLYIDDTGTKEGDLNADKTVSVVKGGQYIPVSIFPNPGYESQWESMGVVTDIWIQW